MTVKCLQIMYLELMPTRTKNDHYQLSRVSVAVKESKVAIFNSNDGMHQPQSASADNFNKMDEPRKKDTRGTMEMLLRTMTKSKGTEIASHEHK